MKKLSYSSLIIGILLIISVLFFKINGTVGLIMAIIGVLSIIVGMLSNQSLREILFYCFTEFFITAIEFIVSLF